MSGVIKVDTIQKPNGSAPTLANLSINHTGSIIQTVFAAGSSSSQGFGSDTQYSAAAYTDIDSSTLSITPSSSSSKILILATNHIYVPAISNNAWRGANIKILRDSTVISDENGGYGEMHYTQDDNDRYMTYSSRQIIDSPNTTSAITYKCQISSKIDTMILYCNKLNYGSGGHFMAMEIAG